jgi:hypothetical protein
MTAKKWRGSPAIKCEICEASLVGHSFIDGATKMGPWAKMCVACHKEIGTGLGQGRGQMYDSSGRKVAG